MPDTAAERKRRQRQRAAGLQPPAQQLVCSDCLGGRSGLYDDRCRRCWERLTPEGRAAKAARVRATRAKQRTQRINPI